MSAASDEAAFAELPLITAEPIETLRGEWAALHRSVPGATPFSHPAWHGAWLRHLGAGVFPVFLALRHEEALIGVAPLAVEGREARLLGDPNLSDHAGLLVHPGDEQASMIALVEWLMEDLVRSFEAWGLPTGSPLREALLAAAEHYGWDVTEEHEAVTPILELPSGWEAYLGSLAKKQRHELRRKIRNLERAGEVGFESATTPEEVAGAVDGLIEMMRESREDKRAFLTPPIAAFFRDLAIELAALSLTRISTLTLDDRAVARVFTLENDSRTMLYNSGFDPEFAALSAGQVSKAYVVREAIERGHGAVDFLRGDEEYKRHLGGTAQEIVTLSLSAP